MKSIMISIKPEMVAKILNGDKTIEIRKTMPKCELPCKVYIYCTKPKKWYADSPFTASSDELLWKLNNQIYSGKNDSLWNPKFDEGYSVLNGRIVAEFTLNTTECFTTDYRKNAEQTARICRQSCVDIDDLIEYEYGSPCLYAWHIDDLKIYDEPKLLQEFFKPCEGCDKLGTDRCTEEISYCRAKVLRRPPQSWCYVEENSDVKD